jgi:hypothetical protein
MLMDNEICIVLINDDRYQRKLVLYRSMVIGTDRIDYAIDDGCYSNR